MTVLMIAFAVFVIAITVNVLALVTSREGATRSHRAAFATGMAGLIALAMCLLGFIGLALQFFHASLASPSGVLFVTSSIVVATCTVASLVFCIRLSRRQKPAGA